MKDNCVYLFRNTNLTSWVNKNITEIPPDCLLMLCFKTISIQPKVYDQLKCKPKIQNVIAYFIFCITQQTNLVFSNRLF